MTHKITYMGGLCSIVNISDTKMQKYMIFSDYSLDNEDQKIIVLSRISLLSLQNIRKLRKTKEQMRLIEIKGGGQKPNQNKKGTLDKVV